MGAVQRVCHDDVPRGLREASFVARESAHIISVTAHAQLDRESPFGLQGDCRCRSSAAAHVARAFQRRELGREPEGKTA